MTDQKSPTTTKRKPTTTTTTNKENNLKKPVSSASASPSTHSQELSIRLHEALVPDAKFADRYIGRLIEGYPDFDILDFARSAKQNVLLTGPTGSGKSNLVRAYGAARGLATAVVSCSSATDLSLLFGALQPTPGPNGSIGLVWADGLITSVVRHGGVLFLDEVNLLAGDVASGLNDLIRDRCLTVVENGTEIVPAHDNLLIIAARNDGEGYLARNDLDHAFRNRFALQFTWDYDTEVEEVLVGVPELALLAESLRRAIEKSVDVKTPCPTNALQEFSLLARAFDTEFAINNFLNRYEDTERPKVLEIITLCKLADVVFE